MIEVYQILKATEKFVCNDGFDEERLERCFRAFQDDLYLGRIHGKETSWLFMSKESATDYCFRHDTNLDKLLKESVGMKMVIMEYNYIVTNNVFD